MILVHELVCSTLILTISAAYLFDRDTIIIHEQETTWGVFCLFFPQLYSYFRSFDLLDLLGSVMLAIYGIIIILWNTDNKSIFNQGERSQ